MIHDLLLRWVVTGLFALTAAECGLAIVIKRQPWTSVVSHGLHFVMAVAMVVMAWPWNAPLPTTGPAVFFALAAVLFVTIAVVAARTTARRLLFGYHTLMMLATAWMYAIMNGHLLPAGFSYPAARSAGSVDAGHGHGWHEHAGKQRAARLVRRAELARDHRLRGRRGFLDI